MNWREFFKPTILKIIIFIILFTITTLFFYGLPLKYVIIVFGGTPNVNYLNLFIDIIFWYFISCMAVAIYYKIKK